MPLLSTTPAAMTRSFAAPAFLATPAAALAAVFEMTTCQAGELGRIELTIYKVAGERNRYFLLVEDALRVHDFANYQISEQGWPVAEVFAKTYCKTLLQVEQEVAEIKRHAKAMQDSQEWLAAKPNRFTVAKSAQIGASLFAEWYGLAPQYLAA